MTADDKAGKPRKTKERLTAMQARHAVAEPEPEAAPQPTAAAGGGGSQGGAAAALIGDLKAAMADGQGGRAVIMQRLRQVLSGPDGQIDPQRARMALIFVRKQAGDPSAPRHELAKRIEDFVRNMQPQQRQRLMAAAGLGGAMAAGGGQGRLVSGKNRAQAPMAGGGAKKAGAWFDDFLDKH